MRVAVSFDHAGFPLKGEIESLLEETGDAKRVPPALRPGEVS
jgi:ribose 5-phosphate isomerase RpiB